MSTTDLNPFGLSLDAATRKISGGAGDDDIDRPEAVGERRRGVGDSLRVAYIKSKAEGIGPEFI